MVPSYLVLPSLWAALWPIPCTALLTALVVQFLHRPRIARRKFYVVVLAFASLGIVTGLLAGFSRTSAMGAVLPAVLSLVGGLGIYLVGAEKADQGLVATCVIALSLNLLLGTLWGATLRDDFERESTSAMAGKRAALAEVEVREFRRELGLPDSPPAQQAKKDSD